MADYWLDSDVLIESKKRWYRFSIAPGFWSFIDEKVEEGVIRASSQVYEELVNRSDDELAEWARERKGPPLFVDPDETVQGSLKEIVGYVQLNYPATKATEDFLSGADPWVIAHAHAYGGVVITLEKADPGSRKVKIPDVCVRFGVTCDSPFEMLQRLGMVLA